MILLFLFGPVFQASAEISNRVVAIVNDDVITLYELNARIRDMTGMEPSVLRVKDEKKYLEARRKILDLLIDEKITESKIQELGIKVTEQQVDEAIERVKQRNNMTHEDLVQGLRGKGLTFEEYRSDLRKNLQRARLINYEVKSKIVISEQEVEAYYADHKGEFRSEAKVGLATIILKRDRAGGENPNDPAMVKAKEILSRIRAGEDFGELAKAFSEGPGAEEGGELGDFDPEKLDPELSRIVKGLSVGEVSEPINRAAAVQIIKLTERQASRQQSLEEVREEIQDILFREEVNKRYSVWINELREQAYTKIIF
jgi:peptidyl-prolyl cis-trans isomerase SurA